MLNPPVHARYGWLLGRCQPYPSKLVPGTRAGHWTRPMRNASAGHEFVHCPDVGTLQSIREAHPLRTLDDQDNDPVRHEGNGHRCGIEEMVLDERTERQAEDGRGNEREQQTERELAARQAEGRCCRSRPFMPNHCKHGTSMDRDRGQMGGAVVESQQRRRQGQVPCRSDRQIRSAPPRRPAG